MVLVSVVSQSKAACVAVGAGEGVITECTSRTRVDMRVLCGRGGRLVGGLGVNSMLCVKEQAVSSTNVMMKTTLEIFMNAMLP